MISVPSVVDVLVCGKTNPEIRNSKFAMNKMGKRADKVRGQTLRPRGVFTPIHFGFLPVFCGVRVSDLCFQTEKSWKARRPARN